MDILVSILLRLKNILIALDQLLYTIITLGSGNPDETCSSAAYRMEAEGKFFGFFRPIIDTLFFFDDNHCKESYENELAKKDFIKTYNLERESWK